MSISMRYGYRVFVTFHPNQPWTRYNPLITLSGTYRGRLYPLIEKPFDQRYLTYYTILFYRKFYDKHIREQKVVEAEVVKGPPPPPTTYQQTKPMFAPPPPKD